MKILRGIFIAILSLLAVSMIAGLSYEFFSRQSVHRKYDSGQAFVNLGNYKLHYNVSGNSGPTVVFESGLDFGGSLCWYKVQPEVARFANTFTYDRAGIFLSERGGATENGLPDGCRSE
ncbi:hypothetical protein SAMN05192574_105324 [Mucilaginibacter gossypiicola]|uniref:Uncharacterized protein n=1 Tax=Mucilaginibacter gossypiicola TaxID=551995 RepID=A0A1H8LZT2_9SPHI|nr:hypothetical protein [Mucilaginibacter gossypiicola]SEO10615.1 hypothetical protein SAMN05192574_105324 [Mucilaginibacter gossypiicola]